MSKAGLALSLLVAFATPGTPGGADGIHAVDLGGLDTRSAALMLSSQEAGDLDVSALAIPLLDPEAAERSRMTLVVDVDGGSLLAGIAEANPAPQALITEIYAYALDAGGELVASLTQAIRLDLASHRPALAAGGVKFFGSLELPAGSYSLRVLVLQRSSGRLGLRILPIEVPSWAPEQVLLPPVRREPPAGWILVRAAGETPAFPVLVGDEPWVPSARRSLDAGSSAPYLLLGRGLGSDLRAQLLDADREFLVDVDLGEHRPADGPSGLEALTAELDTATLEAGEYRLRIKVAGTADVASADSAPLIVRLTEDPMPEPTAEPVGLSARQSRGHRAVLERYEELRDGYRLTLNRLASGDRATAFEPLMEIENRRVGTGAVEEQARLARAQVEIARELSRPDPDRLLTVIWIHEALYRRYHRSKRYLLATHSRQVVSRLAELYLERDRSPRGRRLIAGAMISLGGYLQETGALMAAEGAYHDALTHDANHPAALIGLAAIQESYGDYEAATAMLQRLHKLQPEDTEVRLRLGVNLKRLKKARRAMAHLQSAISEPGPDWVAAVAAQELASLHAGEKRSTEAVSVLEEAVTRHPQVQRLKLQLAAMLDRTGRRNEALAALDGLDPTLGSDVSSPRLRYSRANTGAIHAVRHALAEEANRGLGISPRSSGSAVAGGGS